MSDPIFERVREIIAEQAMLDVSEVKPESTPEELGLDSLGLVEIVFAIEEAFEISVPYNANDPESSDFDISSVKAVAEAVMRLKEEQA